MTVGGHAFELPTLERRTYATDGGALLPTPTATANMLAPSMQKWASHRNLWPTPDAAVMNLTADPQKHLQRIERLKAKHGNNGAGLTLGVAVRLWPTPDANLGNGGRVSKNPPTGRRPSGSKQQITLNDAVKWRMFPTPTASDSKSGSMSEQARAARAEHPRGEKLANEIGGNLNPTWVEWLMGWPLGWTVSRHWVTARSRSRRRSAGSCAVDP